MYTKYTQPCSTSALFKKKSQGSILPTGQAKTAKNLISFWFIRVLLILTFKQVNRGGLLARDGFETSTGTNKVD